MDTQQKLKEIDLALGRLQSEKSFDNAEKVVHAIANLLSLGQLKRLPYRSEKMGEKSKTWYQNAIGHTNIQATFEFLHADNDLPIDLKLFWLRQEKRYIISASANLSSNYEDSPIFSDKNIGIDIFLSPELDKITIALSSEYKLRIVEMSGKLSPTQMEVLAHWDQPFDRRNKKAIHEALWESFNIEPLNKKFYTVISQKFTELVQHLDHNGVTTEDAKQFTNRLIGRLIFCWFLRKKKIISEKYNYFDVGKLTSDEYYNKVLKILFFSVLNTPKDLANRKETILDFGVDLETPYLNGGLFEEHSIDSSIKVSFPNNFFKEFYSVLDHYNFTTDESTSDYQQVAVDPEMLGRIFENLLAELSTETGESARKAKGAFYTRREVVDFMCRASLRSYLATSLENVGLEATESESINEQLLSVSDAEYALYKKNESYDLIQVKHRDKILNALDTITVIDPACGSGAYPIGMMQLIYRCYERIFPESKFDPIETKKRILRNSIFGVDIEPMAVEISRLRAWLSIIVDEEDANNVQALPNLDFKFICANSLVHLDSSASITIGKNTNQITFGAEGEESLEQRIRELRSKYFLATNHTEKLKIQKGISELISKYTVHIENKSRRFKQLHSFDFFNLFKCAEFFDSSYMFGIENGFDIVIGNPPYVSTKGDSQNLKALLVQEYGFFDDLYSHFYFRGLELCKQGGVLSYITSKTFWTIQSKRNLRDLLLENNLQIVYDTANPFDSVMVDTCVIVVQKREVQNAEIAFLKSEGDYLKPPRAIVEKKLYLEAVNRVIFEPTQINLKIHHKYSNTVKGLMEKWWPMINTSKNITKYTSILEKNRTALKPGDIVLLGQVTEGGQGLATANNGRYVGVISTSKEAIRIKATRIQKFLKFVNNKGVRGYGNTLATVQEKLNKLSEPETRELFDTMKVKYGRDIFGQGFIYRVVSPPEVADLDKLTELEKKNGIKGTRTFVPYDKGDKDGNRWYLKTPYYIDWSFKNVELLKKDPKARYQGHQFYFREGFCWTNVLNPNSRLIKAKLKGRSVNDVGSMALYSVSSCVSDKYCVCLINSSPIFDYYRTFINSSVNIQINDLRQIPMVIPTKEQLANFEQLFDKAYNAQMSHFDGSITKAQANKTLEEIQKELDVKVIDLYGLDNQ